MRIYGIKSRTTSPLRHSVLVLVVNRGEVLNIHREALPNCHRRRFPCAEKEESARLPRRLQGLAELALAVSNKGDANSADTAAVLSELTAPKR